VILQCLQFILAHNFFKKAAASAPALISEAKSDSMNVDAHGDDVDDEESEEDDDEEDEIEEGEVLEDDETPQEVDTTTTTTTNLEGQM